MPATLGRVSYDVQLVSRFGGEAGEPVTIGTLSVDIPIGLPGDRPVDPQAAGMEAVARRLRRVQEVLSEEEEDRDA